MGGDNTKSSTITITTTTTTATNDNNRKSRWQSSSSTTTPPTKNPSPSQKPPPTGTPSRPSSNKPTPKHSLTPTQTQTPTPSSQSQQQQPPFPFSPPPPPSYGFHLLDRRTIVLADSSVRTYFALPPDYQDFTPPPRPRFGPPPHPFKRKFGFGDDADSDAVDHFARQKQQLLQFANAGSHPGPGLPSGTSSPFSRRNDEEYRTNNKYMRFDGASSTTTTTNNNNNNNVGVDPAVMKAFLNFVKLLNENSTQRKNYLENGKHGPLQCLACARSSKDFQDVHALIMHAYNSENADLRVDHLGLHRALCVLMGWNYMRAPDNSRTYQLLPAEEAAAYQNDLIMWPPMVIINNTNTGKGKDGRMEGLGNKAMDSKLRDLGFSAGKSKSLYSRDGHLGITLIKFPSEQSGLKEAMRLAEHFEKEHHGRSDWARVRSTATDRDEESNPNLVMLDQRTGERRRILYGYLATVSDLDKVDYETRKKVVIESKHEKLQTPN
ncbi:Protein SUPPRESSOR OF GENE SILENCING 3 [Bienertia sinuspersici]